VRNQVDRRLGAGSGVSRHLPEPTGSDAVGAYDE
jgi:hypothetical protein